MFLGLSAACSLLGIRSSASHEDARQAYRKELLKAHPDKGGCPEKFRKIRQAWELISARRLAGKPLGAAAAKKSARPPKDVRAAAKPSAKRGAASTAAAKPSAKRGAASTAQAQKRKEGSQKAPQASRSQKAPQASRRLASLLGEEALTESEKATQALGQAFRGLARKRELDDPLVAWKREAQAALQFRKTFPVEGPGEPHTSTGSHSGGPAAPSAVQGAGEEHAPPPRAPLRPELIAALREVRMRKGQDRRDFIRQLPSAVSKELKKVLPARRSAKESPQAEGRREKQPSAAAKASAHEGAAVGRGSRAEAAAAALPRAAVAEGVDTAPPAPPSDDLERLRALGPGERRAFVAGLPEAARRRLQERLRSDVARGPGAASGAAPRPPGAAAGTVAGQGAAAPLSLERQVRELDNRLRAMPAGEGRRALLASVSVPVRAELQRRLIAERSAGKTP